MADFISNGWSVYIIAVTLISIVGCFILAFSLASSRVPNTDADGNVGTTGHVWDENLTELNHPLPRWWLYLFYITCVFAVVYLVMYPGLGSFKGMLGWSSTGQYDDEVTAMNEVVDPLFDAHLGKPIEELANDPEAVAMGQRLFLTYCVQCHGSDARGSRSFPNLADNDWLGAGTPEYVKTTILNGRTGVMTPMAAALGGEEAVENVANYVLSLSGSDHDAAKAEAGKEKFIVCSGCHMPTGTGNPAIGAPNLTDDTWLYGGSLESVKHAINNGFNNKMPGFGELLGDAKAHVLAGYVWSLSQQN